MRDLAVAVLGTAYSTYNNASDLLDDFFPEDTVVYLPSYIPSEQTGLRVTFDWLKDAGIDYERVRKSQLLGKLTSTSAKRYVLIVIGVEDSEDIIIDTMAQGIPVFDLTRGLYSVTAADIALRGSDSQSERVSDDTGITTGVGEDLAPAFVSEPQKMQWISRPEILEQLSVEQGTVYKLWDNDELLYIGQTTKPPLIRMYSHAKSGLGKDRWDRVNKIETLEIPVEILYDLEFALIHFYHPPFNSACECEYRQAHEEYKTEEDILRAHMEIGESGWEPPPADILDAADILVAEERFAQTKEVVDETKIKYYKSARGKLRKAGKSKARPGETEVWLTDEEANE